MGCRIGMSTDVPRRVRELKDANLVPEDAVYSYLAIDLDYDEANKREAEERRLCGPHCDGQGGGQKVPGNVWHVYRLDW